MSTITGNLNNTTPAAPSLYVNVIWQMDSIGRISGYVPNTLASDQDVAISGIAGGDILVYNASTGLWTNKLPTLAADSDVSLASLQDGQVLTYVAASSNWQNKTPSSAGPGTTLTTDLGQRWQFAPLAGSAITGGSVFGNTPWSSAGTVSNANDGGTTPPGNLCTTSSSAGSSAGACATGATGTGFFSLATLGSCVFALKLSQITNMRIWIGLFNLGGSGGGVQTLALRSDTPGSVQAAAAFRFSTAAGDSKYQCVTGSGTAQTTTAESTTSHVDATNIHIFMIRYIAPNVVFYIDGVQVGSQNTNLPSTSTNLIPQVFIDNVGTANAQAFTFYGARGQWAGV